VRYWYHPESESWFITHGDDFSPAGEGCDEVTKTRYKKRK
jgi:hypothetical protein